MTARSGEFAREMFALAISAGAPAPATGRVLLLEDDPSFNKIIKVFLTESGYTVTAVQNGVEGIREVLAGDFVAILCDMMMPTLPGDLFYRAVERARPHLCARFVFMTGHLGSRANFIQSVNGFVLQKPFQLKDLLDSITFAEVRGSYRRIFESEPIDPIHPGVCELLDALPGVESPPQLETEVAPEVPAYRSQPAAVDPVPEPAVETLVVEQRREWWRPTLTTCLGLALLAGLIAIPVRWQLDLGRRGGVLASELRPLETQWTAAAQQQGYAETARTRNEESLKLAKRIAEDRAAPRWGAALRSLAKAAGPNVELRDVQARAKSDDQGACDLRVAGVCTGQSPREIADQLWRELEANLKRHFPANGVTTRLERLDDEPPLPSASPNQQRAAFTILVTTGAKALELGRSEGR